MTHMAKLAALGFLLMLAGCVPSLHPLYTDADVIFDPALVGVWAEKDSRESWAFTREGEKQYRLVYTDENGRRGEFIAHLLKAEGQRFLDLFPVEPYLQQNDFYRGHLLPVHTFLLISQIEPTLRMSCLDPEWLKRFLARNQAAIRHEKLDDEILLTASPKQLQKFLLTHLKTKGAFGEPSELRRGKEG
jgi:hypothetical protein